MAKSCKKGMDSGGIDPPEVSQWSTTLYLELTALMILSYPLFSTYRLQGWRFQVLAFTAAVHTVAGFMMTSRHR